MLRALPLLLLLVACGGDDDDSLPDQRTACEDDCFDREVPICNQSCQNECAGQSGDAFDRCVDACQGGCLQEYDACVAEEC